MAKVGINLIRNSIDLKKYGYVKLRPFFDSNKNEFIIGVDERTNLPLIKNIDDKFVIPVMHENKLCVEKKEEIMQLTKWANINQKEAIESLKNIAIKECWSFKNENDEYPSPILAKYLKWTFVKVMRENKILYENKYASFNTGLVDKFYNPIFAVFDRNRYNKQPWHFIEFCVAGGNTVGSRILSEYFSLLPERAIYIKNYDDVIYDTTLPVDVNWEHIILENIDRLPFEFLRHLCGGMLVEQDIQNFNTEERELYYCQLRNELESDPMRLSLASSMMSTAVEMAKCRVAWNYKTAIPVYYPKDDRVHLILPLALNIHKPEEISIALVMTKTPSRRYRAVTIFTLDMAYSNARLVTKPSSDWLVAE